MARDSDLPPPGTDGRCCVVGSKYTAMEVCEEGAPRVYYEDMYSLDLKDWTWQREAINGRKPMGRMACGFSSDGERILMTCGLGYEDERDSKVEGYKWEECRRNNIGYNNEQVTYDIESCT